MANYGPTWLDRLILRLMPADWDGRVTSGYIADRVPGLTALEATACIKKNLVHRFVEIRKVPPCTFRLKPGLILGVNVFWEADP